MRIWSVVRIIQGSRIKTFYYRFFREFNFLFIRSFQDQYNVIKNPQLKSKQQIFTPQIFYCKNKPIQISIETEYHFSSYKLYDSWFSSFILIWHLFTTFKLTRSTALFNSLPTKSTKARRIDCFTIGVIKVSRKRNRSVNHFTIIWVMWIPACKREVQFSWLRLIFASCGTSSQLGYVCLVSGYQDVNKVILLRF